MSMRRSSRRYLRNAVDTTHEFQEFLNENPAVASSLATVGNLMVNAVMQSKYGPAIQQLLNPGAGAAAPAAAAAAPATPAAATPAAARPAAKKAGPARPSMKKKVAKKKVAKKKVAKKAK